MALPTKPATRAKFAQYLFDRRAKPGEVAAEIGCSREQLRRICLPFDDPQWRAPSHKLKQKVDAWTKGEIGLNDWERPARSRARELAA